MRAQRVAVAGSAIERRRLNGPRRVLPKVRKYGETSGIRQLSEGCWSLAKRDQSNSFLDNQVRLFVEDSSDQTKVAPRKIRP